MLETVAFDRAHWLRPEVQSFTCGSAPWEVEVGKWVAADESEKFDSALYCVEHGKCSVWLHLLARDPLELVGFTSLGQSSWKLSQGKLPVQLVPNFAVATRYQGQPAEAKPAERYAHVMFRDVVAEAATRWKAGAPKLLALFVHPNNLRAIRFYQAGHKFEALPAPMPNGYTGMVRELHDEDLPPAEPPVDATRSPSGRG